MVQLYLQVALAGTLCASVVRSTFVTPILPISFFFDWNPDPPLPFPSLVTEQCETIHIKWSRGAALGPNPVAPYTLQVYTSNFIQPFVIQAGEGLSFDWTVPFAPGTQYQICMFDKFGSTGGCQDKYTVIPPSSPSTCTNVTFATQLDVSAIVDNGPMSQYGFVDQCTDISVTPLSGTPPYTLTVAPSLHPPYNITSFDMKPINWTVSLNWAMPFFISLADSTGSLWSNGPLHAGSGGNIACLAGNITASRSVKVPIAIGASFGALMIGALIGVIGLLFLSKRRSDSFVQLQDSQPKSLWTKQDTSARPRPPEVNPFRISMTREETLARDQVYGQHRDNFKVSALAVVNTDIVELPPGYLENPSDSDRNTIRELDIIRRNLSIGSTITMLGTETGKTAAIRSFDTHASQRHYDPRGPLTFNRTRLTGESPRRPIRDSESV